MNVTLSMEMLWKYILCRDLPYVITGIVKALAFLGFCHFSVGLRKQGYVEILGG